MARPVGQPENHLIRNLADSPQGHEIFQAIRILEAMNPAAARVGFSVSPEDEALRFEQVASGSFPPTDIADLLEDAGSNRRTLLIHAFGLLGPHGPLPGVLTDYILGRLSRRDHALLRFVNLFNHRLTGFYYRAWAAGNKAVDYDRARSPHSLEDRETSRQGPRFRHFLACLSGAPAEPAFTADQSLADAFLYFSGRFSAPAPNAEGLKSILDSIFGVRVAIEMFRPRWIEIPESNRWRLGAAKEAGRLGTNAFLGSRVLDHQSTFRIVLGPLDKADFDRLLPLDIAAGTGTGASFERLRTMVRHYTRDQFFWDVQYILKGKDVPRLDLYSTTFTGDSLVDTRALASRLKDPSDEVSGFVSKFLSVETRRRIEGLRETDPIDSLRALLVEDLNRLLRQDTLYDSRRFAGIALRQETEQLSTKRKRTPGDVVRLNRLLLEDAYPAELNRGRRLGLDTWLRSERGAQDADDVVVDPDHYPSRTGGSPISSATAYADN